MRFLVHRRRVVLPFVLAAICLMASGWVSPVAGWLLIMAAFGCVLDGVLALAPTTGTLAQHRQ